MAPYNEKAVIQNKENVTPSQALIPFEPNPDNGDLPDFDLIAILNEFEANNNTTIANNCNSNSNVTTVSTTHSVVNHVPRAMFSNCNIQNITFNIQK